MTAHPDRYRQPPDHRPTTVDDLAATRDDSPRVAGPVPITVWRPDDRDDDQPATEPGAGFASRLARRLVVVYTRHGDTVVDFGHDPHLHHVATVTGRSSLAVTEPALDQTGQSASLVMLRWPRDISPTTADRVADLFTACRLMTSGDASAVAAVRRSDPGDAGTVFVDHQPPASRGRSGRARHVPQMVAVNAPARATSSSTTPPWPRPPEHRGTGNAHEQFDIPIPRDGGIADLLAEAKRPDRRFVAVVCESIERIARVTYFSTKIEYELEQAGVALLAADEGIDVASIPSLNDGSSPFRRATPTLTRRVKQAIAEWYVLNMLELSWGGLKAHTGQGYNDSVGH